MIVGRLALALTHAVVAVLFCVNEARQLRLRGVRGSVGNATEEEMPCTAPDAVRARAESQGLVLLDALPTHVVFGVVEDEGDDPDEEVSLVVYDCGKQKELVFVHIPKNAGTSIEDLAHDTGIDWGRYHDLTGGRQKMPDGNKCSKWHVPPALKAPPNPYNDSNVDVFCVTRDPWERMRSEYTYRLSKEHAWGAAPHLLDSPRCTISGFNDFVKGNLETVEDGKPYVLDCHLVPQWQFIQNADGHLWCKEILPIHDLTPRFNELMVSYHLPVRMAPYDKHNSKADFCPTLSEVSTGVIFWPSTQIIFRRVYEWDLLAMGDSLAPYGNFHMNSTSNLSNRSGA